MGRGGYHGRAQICATNIADIKDGYLQVPFNFEEFEEVLKEAEEGLDLTSLEGTDTLQERTNRVMDQYCRDETTAITEDEEQEFVRKTIAAGNQGKDEENPKEGDIVKYIDDIVIITKDEVEESDLG